MRARLRYVLGLMGVGLACGFAGAQPAVPSEAKGVPPLPALRSPVGVFRDLLGMSAAEREVELAKRPAEIRKRILAKVAEYEAMSAEDREQRLRVTELRWYLARLMNLPANGRADTLAAVPEDERQSVADRLQQWDRLPTEDQKEILKYEQSMEHFTEQNLRNPMGMSNALTLTLPPAPPGALKNLDNFLQLPPEQRQQMYASFQRLFELTDAEKQRAVEALSDAQREQVTAMMRSFKQLPKEQREERLQAFTKFSNMTSAERAVFMKNAERWRQLSPAERDAWRSLVNRLPPSPPLPPGVVFPPLPPRSALQASLPMATNNSP